MSEISKVITTLGIWAAIVGILVLGDVGPNNMIWVTLIMGAAAAISTGFIWDNKRSGDSAEAAKHKRDSRARRLVEKLDEEDIVELEDLLAARRDDRLTYRAE